MEGSHQFRTAATAALRADPGRALAAYLSIQSILVLATGYRPGHSLPGITWTALNAAAIFALAAGKARIGRALDNPVLMTEGRVTLVDGILAVAVRAGLALNAVVGSWWAGRVALAASAVAFGVLALLGREKAYDYRHPPADDSAGYQ